MGFTFAKGCKTEKFGSLVFQIKASALIFLGSRFVRTQTLRVSRPLVIRPNGKPLPSNILEMAKWQTTLASSWRWENRSHSYS
jgi:hypothetical protein